MSCHLSHAETGLVGYWRLDDGEDNLIARNAIADWQGRTNDVYHGVIHSANWFPTSNSRGSGTSNTDSATANTGSGTSNTSSSTSNTSSGTSNTSSGTSNTSSGTSNTGSGTPNTGSGTPSTGSGTSNTGSGTPNTGSGTSNTGSGTPNTGSGTPNNGSDSSNTGFGTNASLSSPSDIAKHWAKPFIEQLLTRKILSPQADGLFKPDDLVTLNTFVASIVKAFDLPLKLDAIAFNNLPTNHPSYANVQKAYQMGFVLRSANNTIDLSRTLSRMEVMTALVRGLDLKGGTVNLLSLFSDRNDIPVNVRRVIATALRRGLATVNPSPPNRLEPTRDISKAELAALIYQSWVIQGNAPAIASPYLSPLPPSLPLFTDIPEAPSQKHWAADFIRGLVDLVLVNGFPDGSFRPDVGMTRGDFAAILVNAFNPAPRSDRLNANISQLFTDVPANHPYFSFIQQIYRSGVMSGLPDNTFGVGLGIQRDQAIAALVALLGLSKGNLEKLNIYSDKANIPSWAQSLIAAATEAGIVVSYNYPTSRQIRATQSATRAEIVAMIYQGLVIQKKVKAIASPHVANSSTIRATP